MTRVIHFYLSVLRPVVFLWVWIDSKLRPAHALTCWDKAGEVRRSSRVPLPALFVLK